MKCVWVLFRGLGFYKELSKVFSALATRRGAAGGAPVFELSTAAAGGSLGRWPRAVGGGAGEIGGSDIAASLPRRLREARHCAPQTVVADEVTRPWIERRTKQGWA